MADGKRREAWSHTSNLLAMLYNVNRSEKAPAASPAQFNPFTPKAAKRVTAGTISVRDLRRYLFPGSGAPKAGKVATPMTPPIGGTGPTVAGPDRSKGPINIGRQK